MTTKIFPIQGLWVGTHLSPIESYCIQSYINQGHEFHLYSYNDFPALPKGTILKDANAIIPEQEIFRQVSGPAKGSLAAFADYFRYNLLHTKGGWWTDMDFLCLNTLKQPNNLFLAAEFRPRRARNNSYSRPWRTINKSLNTLRTIISEEQLKGKRTKILQALAYSQSPTNSLMFAEPANPIMMEAAAEAKKLKDTNLKWGEIGPNLVAALAEKHKGTSSITIGDAHEFMPISYDQIDILNQPSQSFNTTNIKTIHLYNEVWRQNNLDKNKALNRGTLLEFLIRQTQHIKCNL